MTASPVEKIREIWANAAFASVGMHTCTRYATIPRSANPPDYAAARRREPARAREPRVDKSNGMAAIALEERCISQPMARKASPAAISGRKNRIEPLTSAIPQTDTGTRPLSS